MTGAKKKGGGASGRIGDGTGSRMDAASGSRQMVVKVRTAKQRSTSSTLWLQRYERQRVDGTVLDFADIRQMTHRLVGMNAAERAREPCIGAIRADLMIAGCAILEAICRTWNVGRLRVADRGVREGILAGLYAATRAGVPDACIRPAALSS